MVLNHCKNNLIIMKKIHAAITAVGGFVPEYRLTNQELETMIDTNDEEGF